jgi:uncharacterized membrane protein YphA (DoxX/SURF4 family)
VLRSLHSNIAIFQLKLQCMLCCLPLLVNNLTPAISPGIHSSFVQQLNELIRLRVFPYGAVDWSADTVRKVVGAMEVGFGVMVLVPRLTRVAAFFLGQYRKTEAGGGSG